MIILDTSVWIALLNEADTTHKQAKSILKGLNDTNYQLYDFIFSETMTVLRNKVSTKSYMNFLGIIKTLRISILLSTPMIFSQATLYFLRFSRLSFADCLLLSAAKLNKSELLTFDKQLQKAYQSVSN